ncbi:matrix metalloproteinase-28 isoform X4 [Cricetulus griseus]|uniref:Matrix metalloproteinase-28 isoform X4 n=1 Tax=Cricetulus griseus TaxID=10029 RepID=A0A9J7GBV1_CRIGR|nr:matrix metalloproteinase-28 isoform X4 [Cricetulus griseus]XP_027298535.1 matrix metalloproteinase-28 isoform X4 [Cricetulus griseus]
MVPGVSLLLRALLLLLLLLWGCRDAQPARLGHPELRQEAEAFLEKYGYFSEQGSKAPASTQFRNAIREFQWVSQLPISGVLDQATLRQMTLPRCGVADTDSHAAWAKRISALFAGPGAKMRRKKRFARPALGSWHWGQDVPGVSMLYIPLCFWAAERKSEVRKESYTQHYSGAPGTEFKYQLS